jgi:hypothetical protein
MAVCCGGNLLDPSCVCFAEISISVHFDLVDLCSIFAAHYLSHHTSGVLGYPSLPAYPYFGIHFASIPFGKKDITQAWLS